MIRIKICCISSIAEAQTAISFGAPAILNLIEFEAANSYTKHLAFS